MGFGYRKLPEYHLRLYISDDKRTKGKHEGNNWDKDYELRKRVSKNSVNISESMSIYYIRHLSELFRI